MELDAEETAEVGLLGTHGKEIDLKAKLKAKSRRGGTAAWRIGSILGIWSVFRTSLCRVEREGKSFPVQPCTFAFNFGAILRRTYHKNH